jgi:hypothetical protein
MMIKQKYSKILTNSKSTTLPSESPPHRSKIVSKEDKKVKFA